MTPLRLRHRVASVLLFGAVVAAPTGARIASAEDAMPAASPPPSEGPARPTTLRTALRVAEVGTSARSLVHTDAVEARIVAGEWHAPTKGDALTLPDGGKRTWEEVSANERGAFEGAVAEKGAYFSFRVPAESERVVLLHAVGNDFAYVNGELRPGDPYAYGWLRLPILLRKGDNEILVRASRGHLVVALEPPPAPFYVSKDDVTVGDFDPAAPPEGPIVAHPRVVPAAVVVVNASLRPRRALDVVSETKNVAALSAWRTQGPHPIAPLSLLKIPLEAIVRDDETNADVVAKLAVVAGSDTAPSAITIRRVPAAGVRRLTFESSIDGSVQFVAIRPRSVPHDPEMSAAIVTLHGAGVEATNQAASYAPKPWATIIAPTNRRPYGFDWEDWGRLDALEAAYRAQREYDTWTGRQALTGHSMGGHGTWQLAVQHPRDWAAIAPSAGWISFRGYPAPVALSEDPVVAMLDRAASPSDTMALVENLRNTPIYALHGDADDNVPVTEMRTMAARLKEFHKDFVAFEQKGAGHWWDLPGTPGVDCVDWPPMMEFLRARLAAKPTESTEVDFSTMHPGISASFDLWGPKGAGTGRIEAVQHPMRRSRVRLVRDDEQGVIRGTTENIERMSLQFSPWKTKRTSLTVELDGTRLECPLPAGMMQSAMLRRGESGWEVTTYEYGLRKDPERCGPFKAAFSRHFVLVVGTQGTPEENAWAAAKARLDAETWYYRANGLAETVTDVECLAQAKDFPYRNLILYGHAEMNSAWGLALKNSPVDVRRGSMRVGTRELHGDGLACVFIRPRSERGGDMVGVVAGTGLPGMRLTERLPYFSSGVGFPDVTVLSTDMLTKGAPGVVGAGFFGNDWSVEKGEFAWR